MAKPGDNPDEFVLRLRPLPDMDVPAMVRLRRLLKFALRSCRLRCVGIFVGEAETPGDEPATEEGVQRKE